MKVNAFFELKMNESEIKLLLILPIWELWMVDYSPKGMNIHEILLYLCEAWRHQTGYATKYLPN